MKKIVVNKFYLQIKKKIDNVVCALSSQITKKSMAGCYCHETWSKPNCLATKALRSKPPQKMQQCQKKAAEKELKTNNRKYCVRNKTITVTAAPTPYVSLYWFT